VFLYKIVYSIQYKQFSLFSLGFIKHFWGYLTGLHELYCNGPRNSVYILPESILEGVIFVLGFNLFRINTRNVFLFGVGIHLLFEWSGIHKMFCNKDELPI
jgi:hypothetical protein